MKYRPSPIPSGGLEIPIVLVVKKETFSNTVFQKIKNFIEKYHLEQEKIFPKEELKKMIISKICSFKTLKKRA